jgi:hypothetical protein
MSPLTRPKRLLLICLFCLSGCMRVGPDFKPPSETWVEN